MRVAVVGTGNIGTDLLEKLRRTSQEVALFAGIDPDSPGLERARSYGIPISTAGSDPVIEQARDIDLVYEATSAAVHRKNAERYAEVGLRAVDLTPAKLGPPVIPAVNVEVAASAPNVSLTTCGGQATIPVVAALARVAAVEYAEIVSTISSTSAGPGTRQNIDEFTRTTAHGIESVGRATRGKAIIILNPASPPIVMRNTVFALVDPRADPDQLTDSVMDMIERVARYVPGYRIKGRPQFELTDAHIRAAIFLEVRGAGDFLPPYAGNLDIMTSAAVAVGAHLESKAQVQG